MRNKQWLEILSTTNTDKDLNKNNVIEKIKEKLKATDPDTYKKWEETGFNVNYVGNSAGYTLLHLAVKGGHIEIAQALIDRNANVDVLDRKGLAPLHFAAEKGYTKIVDALMNKEADVNVVNKNKSTPLHLAAKGGHTEIAQALIDRSANVNVLDKCRLTPLHFAAVEGHTKIAKALMDKGADPLLEARDVRVLKRLVTLIKNDSLKHPGKAEKKLQNREQINDKYELLKYSLLLRYNCTLVDVVEFDHLICTWSAEVFDFTQEQEKLNENLLSILKDLSSFEDAYIIQLEKFLRDNESNDDLKTILNLGRGESGLTILHVVSSMDKRWKRCVDLLLSAGANPNEKDNRGRTPLHYATEHDIIISLLGKGADSNILDKQEKTPLEVAIDNHNYHVKSSFLTKKQQSLKKEISGTLIPHLIRGKEPSCLTELKKFLNDNKDNEDLKTVLNLRVREGKSEVLQHVGSALYGKTFCKEVESLLLEAGAVDYEGLDGKEHLPKFETLWDSLISSQQQKLKIFLDRVGKAQDMNKLEQVVKDAIEYGVRFNFPYQKSLYEKAYESKYSFMDYVMKRIKEISELKRNSKVASDIVCKLVSRGAVLYTVDSIFVIDTLESEFKDHKTNMLKAHEDYVNRTLELVGIAKSAVTGEMKDAKLDNSTFYLEYSEDSRIDVAKITDGARNLGLVQGEIEYGRDIIRIGKSEVEIITQKGIRHYTDLADNSNIVLTYYTSIGELEVNLYPGKQDRIIVEVSNKKEILEKFKDCKEELGKNCSLGGYLVYNAIERGYFERSGKLCQPSETISVNSSLSDISPLKEVIQKSQIRESERG